MGEGPPPHALRGPPRADARRRASGPPRGPAGRRGRRGRAEPRTGLGAGLVPSTRPPGAPLPVPPLPAPPPLWAAAVGSGAPPPLHAAARRVLGRGRAMGAGSPRVEPRDRRGGAGSAPSRRRAPSRPAAVPLRRARRAPGPPRGAARVRPPRRRAALAGSARTYLVDPASSICLSQRLSHACLSTHGWYSETANGSLNQLWFLWSLAPLLLG